MNPDPNTYYLVHVYTTSQATAGPPVTFNLTTDELLVIQMTPGPVAINNPSWPLGVVINIVDGIHQLCLAPGSYTINPQGNFFSALLYRRINQ